MKFVHFAKLAALGFACALSVTPAAAQTATGSMVPVDASPAAKASGKLSRSVEFPSVAAAAAHCPDSAIVWSTLNKSHSFHGSGSRYYGKTKHGAYVCKSDALAAGFHQAKS
jgi:hypothetical protein